MKIVNSFNVLFIIFLSFSCNERKIDNKAKLVIPNPDSVYYYLNEDTDQDKTSLVFLVTRSFYVNDSIFGGCNSENGKKAFDYAKKVSPENPNIFIKYRFYHFDESYIEFASLLFHNDFVGYPVLSRGEGDLYKISKEGFEFEESTYIRIKEINEYNLDTRCINLTYKNKKWVPFSKEKLTHFNKIEYCVDTNRMVESLHNEIFDWILYYDSDFDCK